MTEPIIPGDGTEIDEGDIPYHTSEIPQDDSAPTNSRHHGWWGLTAIAMREAEWAGTIEASEELAARVGALPYPAAEINNAFNAFVDQHGRTAGGTILLNDLTPEWRAALEEQGLVRRTGRNTEFTHRGADLFELLQEYGRSDRVWRSLRYDPAVRGDTPKDSEHHAP
jgi:hypothetical protein